MDVKRATAQVSNVYSVSDCVNDDFADYVDCWKHNYWRFFDSPELIQSIARLLGQQLIFGKADLEFVSLVSIT
jgi:hypothetical protein